MSSSRSKAKRRKRDSSPHYGSGQSKASSSSASGSSKKKDKESDDALVKAIKHYDVFYNQAPPGLVQEDKDRPEDCIPNLPENKEARDFLAKAPTKGLWMPLGKEVKVMKCWRCKTYGHRTGDKECPMYLSGNSQIEQFRYSHEDPMHDFIKDNKRKQNEERVRQLQLLLNDSSSSSSSSGGSTSSSTSQSSSSSSDEKRSRRKHKAQSDRKKSKKRRKKQKKLN